jgi:hypothetical protein
MVEITKSNLGGLVLLAILLSTGTTLYVQDAGSKTSCSTGWNIVESGVNEGQYYCSISNKYQLCFDIKNSSSTKDYWCEKGTSVIPKQLNPEITGTQYLCNSVNCVKIR